MPQGFDQIYNTRDGSNPPPLSPVLSHLVPLLPCRRATVEEVEEEDASFTSVMGPPVNPNIILEYCGPELEDDHRFRHLDDLFDGQSLPPSTTSDAGHEESPSLTDRREDGPDLDDGPIDDSDDESAPPPTAKAKWTAAPTKEEVKAAFDDLVKILRPVRISVRQRYKDPELDKKTKERLLQMKTLCFHVLDGMQKDPNGKGIWTKASILAAQSFKWDKPTTNRAKNPGLKKANQLRKWLRDFIDDREEVPTCNWQTTGRSLIDDEDFVQEINAHLQTLGPFFSAEDIQAFIGQPEMLTRLHRTKTISLATARRWLKKMGFRWTVNPKGQYVDGHEREDVVTYRNHTFLPAIAELEDRMQKYGNGDGDDGTPSNQDARRVVLWFHDESIFYAHDRRRTRWVHQSETAKPYKKGEGHSLMIADFVSADYGWLQSPDGKENARVLFRPGKNREGYFDNKDIREQAARAMEILKKYYPDEDHVLIFDNATTHLKRPEGSLSALRMTKGPSQKFMVEVNDIGEDGRARYSPDGKIQKKKIRMGNAKFNGVEQPLYFPDSPEHPHAGQFKGMTVILQERGLVSEARLKAQCGTKMSDCPSGATACCQRRVLFLQPDFVNVESMLEVEAREKGFRVLFLPKFHCELNFIEQCWGAAKRAYRLLPASSTEGDLEKNVVASVDGVELMTMRR